MALVLEANYSKKLGLPGYSSHQAKLFRAIESYVEGVQREDWVPNPNVMGCACCEYFSECRLWAGKEIHESAH
jgi:hypothetical protein